MRENFLKMVSQKVKYSLNLGFNDKKQMEKFKTETGR